MFDTASNVPNRSLTRGPRAPHRVLRFVQVGATAALGFAMQACAAEAPEGPGGPTVTLEEPAVDLKAGCRNGTTNYIEVCSSESSTCLGYKTSGQHCLVTNLECVVEPDADGVVRGRWEVTSRISYFIEDGSDMMCIF